MREEVPDEETAIRLTEEYADSECVGQFGEVAEVEECDTKWIVTFRMHTYSETISHSVEITKSVGNVISHDRSSRFE